MNIASRALKRGVTGGLIGAGLALLVNRMADEVVLYGMAIPPSQWLTAHIVDRLTEPFAAFLGALLGVIVGLTWEQRPRIFGCLLIGSTSIFLAAVTGLGAFRGSLDMCMCSGEEENPLHTNTFWMALPMLWQAYTTLLYGGWLLIKALPVAAYWKRMTPGCVS